MKARWGLHLPRLMVATALCGLLPLATAMHLAAATRQVSTIGVDASSCVTVACRTIGYAIGQATDGDTITVAAGTYTEHDIAVNKSVTITGAGAGSTTVDAQSSGRVFRLGDATKTIALSGMTITGGHLSGNDGGGIYNMATLTLTNTIVGGNYVECVGDANNSEPNLRMRGGYGGGILNASGATLTLVGTSVTTNTAGSDNTDYPTGPGGGSGGGIANRGTLTAQGGSIIGSNTAKTKSLICGNGVGGGLEDEGFAATITVRDCSVTDNRSPNFGAAISTFGGSGSATVGAGSLTIAHSTIANNTTGTEVYGNGPAIEWPFSQVTVTNSTIANNVGGGLEIQHLTMADSNVNGNSGMTGGIRVGANGFIDITRSAINNNNGNNGYGGILASGFVTITDSQVSGNRGSNVGGALLTGSVTITNSTISGNTAPPFVGSGGGNSGTGGLLYSGFAAQQQSLTIANSTISGNATANPYPSFGDGSGGGLVIRGPATITGSTISGNSAPSGMGGGIYVYYAGGIGSSSTPATQTTITNNTVSGNTGGGIRFRGDTIVFQAPDALTLTNVTVANNDQGILHDNVGNVTLTNTVLKSVANNNCAGCILSGGYNIDSGPACITPGGTDLLNTDPKIGPLASNGGPTQTHALLVGSPAIDRIPAAGGCNGAGITTDQRGIGRPFGAGCDMGAYELKVDATPPQKPAGPPSGSNPGVQPAQRPSGQPAGQAPNPQPQPRP